MASSAVKTPEIPAATQQKSDPHTPVLRRHKLEYWLAYGLLKFLGFLPHAVARGIGRVLALLAFQFWGRLRKVGMFNLRLAFPDWTDERRLAVLRGLFRGFGRMLADFAYYPHIRRDNIEKLIIYDGFEDYAQAHSEGKGVLYLTAHFGNWELSSFAHGVYGHPLSFIVRELDNPLVDRLINRYRCLSGGRAIEKRDAAREVLKTLHRGEAVGILSDQNMLAGDGSFVDFFGIPACSTAAPARFARKTGAAVLFTVTIWDEKLGKYRLRFERVPWIRGDNPEEEILANTQNYARLLEEHTRRYPEQWLWVHRRWKTRPPGEPPLYTF
jgi:Kdo2-lipid IVA lauroyltransferase/acyltransferase